MSVAGLGLSLGELAQAKSHPTSQSKWIPAFGMPSPQVDEDGATVAAADDGFASVPSGPLDVTLSSGEATAQPSEEDRAAVALAMVLMAEPASSGAAMAMPEFASSAPRWQFSDEFLRDFRDVPSPSASFGSQGSGATRAAADPVDAEDLSRGPGEMEAAAPALQAQHHDAAMPVPVAELDLDLGSSGGVDVNLDLNAGGGVDVNLDTSSGGGVDVNLELAGGVDLNLDLSVSLDLNLDLGAGVDLRLDRPPVFAVSKLKPLGAATRAPGAAFRPEPDSQSCTAASEPPAPLFALPDAVPQPISAAAPGPASAAAPKPAPQIVVASHADRVMRSLEVLLDNDDPVAGRFGAQTEEVFVTSHAEKALLMLASTCARADAEQGAELFQQPLAAEATARPATVKATATATASATDCAKPVASPGPAAKPARRSAMGDSVVAMSERNLDKVRGGFQTSNGLYISFGIERAVYLNGSLVTTTSLNVSDLGKVSSSQGDVSPAVAGVGSLTLIQNGPGNTFVAGPVSAATVGTVVQNTLNDQKIQSVTAINAAVNSLQLVRAQNFQSTLRSALVDSLRR